MKLGDLVDFQDAKAEAEEVQLHHRISCCLYPHAVNPQLSTAQADKISSYLTDTLSFAEQWRVLPSPDHELCSLLDSRAQSCL